MTKTSGHGGPVWYSYTIPWENCLCMSRNRTNRKLTSKLFLISKLYKVGTYPLNDPECQTNFVLSCWHPFYRECSGWVLHNKLEFENSVIALFFPRKLINRREQSQVPWSDDHLQMLILSLELIVQLPYFCPIFPISVY